MKYYSTAGKAPSATLQQAVECGLAPDGGLYMPERIPRLADGLLKGLSDMSFAEIAFQVARPYTEGEIADRDLQRIVAETVDFGAPLVPVGNLSGSGDASSQFQGPPKLAPADPIYALELFHGPSLAFKDFGARFMARVLSHWTRDDDQPLTILVATSGDTGSAVAMGFLDVPGIEVVILYPSGQVSRLQEQQLTTLGHNITALEIEGSFDDCQRLVKQAFQDSDLRARRRLSSANSINLARLIPQMFYYFYAWSRLPGIDRWRSVQAAQGHLPTAGQDSASAPALDDDHDAGEAGDATSPALTSAATLAGRPRVIFSVPSGNFGNLTAGLMAKRMGLPIDRFIAATNANDVVPEYLDEGEFRPRPSQRTLSNAMDVGDPSNFVRMMELYNHDWDAIRRHLCGRRYSDSQTLQAIAQVRRDSGYLLDPHGAVGYLALRDVLEEAEPSRPQSGPASRRTGGPPRQESVGAPPKVNDIPRQVGVFLETAHPAKFLETCQEATGEAVRIPARLARHLDLPKQAVKLPAHFQALQDYLTC